MSKASWTSNQAAAATGGEARGEWTAQGVAIDSRAAAPGALFVAIKGERVDGHAYVAEAFTAGAAAAIVSEIPNDVPRETCLVVNDTLAALTRLGAAGRARSKAKFVGVTGSVGKTSTKEMLKLALAPYGEVFASHGNFNNHIGTPLNLANLAEAAEFAVCEMGMSAAGEISALTKLVRPHVAVITNVEPAHLEFFRDIEAIAEAKAEIFEGVEPGGVAVLNADSPLYAYLKERARARSIPQILTFGEGGNADIRLISYRATPKGCEVEARAGGEKITYTLAATGRHWAITSLAVLAAVQALGLAPHKAAAALAGFREVEGRGRMETIPVNGGEALLIDDSYNASPAAMQSAFARLRDLKYAGVIQGRAVVALGDMRELGATAPQLHEALAERLIECGADAVFTAGPLMRHLHEALPAALRFAHAPDAGLLAPLVREALKPGDTLLVKGSHGSKMYELAEYVRGKK